MGWGWMCESRVWYNLSICSPFLIHLIQFKHGCRYMHCHVDDFGMRWWLVIPHMFAAMCVSEMFDDAMYVCQRVDMLFAPCLKLVVFHLI